MATTFWASALVGFGAFGAPLWPCARANPGNTTTAARTVISLSFMRTPFLDKAETPLTTSNHSRALRHSQDGGRGIFPQRAAVVYAKSTAKRLRSASAKEASALGWVARSTTRGGWPASNASCQRGAHRHQRSPGLRPGKPNSGTGVDRSLPRDLENSRKEAVITTHTVWLPKSSRPVLQQPSR